MLILFVFFFSSRRRHTRWPRDWSSDVCSSDLIYKNIKKAVVFLLTCNLGEVIIMFISILAGLPLPLIATQLLWINLVTDTLPAIALGMDLGDRGVMKEKPRSL